VALVLSTEKLAQKPISLPKDSSVSDVIRKLLDYNISRLVIKDHQRAVGIITEKDVGFFLFNETTKHGLDKLPIDTIMNKITYVDEKEPPKNCAKIMLDKNISSVALGADDTIKGIITKTDLVKHYAENYEGRHKVSEHMTRDFVSTHSAAPLSKVIKKMLENKISRIIIKNQAERPTGIISFRDLFKISLALGSEEDDTGITISEKIRKGFLSEGGFGGISLAGDVATKEIISIKFDADLVDACKLLLENKVSGLAVLDGNNEFSGILSKTDVTRALAS
jgi:CBS domain-containing protein